MDRPAHAGRLRDDARIGAALGDRLPPGRIGLAGAVRARDAGDPGFGCPAPDGRVRGGHCRTGPCDRTVAIDRDGRVHVTLPEPQELGTLAPGVFGDVQQQLSLADFPQLGSRPFTGECPVNFDGQEVIYTFYGATGEIRLASCEVEIDPEDPLFTAIEAALASVQPQ